MTNDRPKSELARSGWEITTDMDEESGKSLGPGWEEGGHQKRLVGEQGVATDHESNHIRKKGPGGGGASEQWCTRT